MTTFFLILMLFGLILTKTIWLRTELRFNKNRFNIAMIKTNIVEAIILLLQIVVVYLFPLPNTPLDEWILSVGVAMYIAGMVLAFWGRKSMKQSWGVPGEHAAKQNSLVTTGPFNFSRNPLYVGFLLIYFGFALAIKSWLIILRIPLAIYFYKSAVREEKLLEKTFGSEYSTYKSQVPRFL
jgi:protein-S-isoprenylcysteine O-methyltransferase Ste14